MEMASFDDVLFIC